MTTRDKLITMKPMKPANWPRSLWRASGLGYCLRQQLLTATGMMYPLDDATERKYDIRTDVHETVQRWMLRNFGHVGTEEFLQDEELHVGGHADALLPDEKTLVEIKTCISYYYGHLTKGRSIPYWGAQIDFYGKMAERVYGDVDVVSLLVNIDNGDLAIIDVDRIPYEPIAETLNFCWETRMLPDVESDKCEKCQFESVCSQSLSTIDDMREAVINEFGEPLLRDGGDDGQPQE